MIIYYALLLMLILGGWLLFESKHRAPSQKITVIYLSAASIFLILISTLRYSIGFDYFSYENIFNRIESSSFEAIFTNPTGENGDFKSYYGYVILNKIIALLGGNYHTSLLFWNLIMTIPVMAIYLKYSKTPWISIVTYVSFQIFAHSMNFVRQSVAAGIIFASFALLISSDDEPNFTDFRLYAKKVLLKKFLPYLLIVLLASTIHSSSLVMIPFFFLLRIPVNGKTMGVLCTISVLGYLFSENIFDMITVILPDVEKYRDTFYYEPGSFVYALFPLLLMIGVIPFIKLLQSGNNKGSILIINATFYYTVISLFITRHFIFERLSTFFVMFVPIITAEIISLFKVTAIDKNLPDISKVNKNQKHKLRKMKREIKDGYFYRYWAVCVVLVLDLACFFFASTSGYHKVYPYVSIFNKEDMVSNEDYIANLQ